MLFAAQCKFWPIVSVYFEVPNKLINCILAQETVVSHYEYHFMFEYRTSQLIKDAEHKNFDLKIH